MTHIMGIHVLIIMASQRQGIILVLDATWVNDKRLTIDEMQLYALLGGT